MSDPETLPTLPDALREHLERLKAAMKARVRAELLRLRAEARAKRLAALRGKGGGGE